MTLVSTTAGMAGCAKLLEKGTLSAKSRIQTGGHWQGWEEIVWFSLSEGPEIGSSGRRVKPPVPCCPLEQPQGKCHWELLRATSGGHVPEFLLKKVFIEFVTILFLFYVLVFQSQGMCDPSSLNKDGTGTLHIGRWWPNNWTTLEVLSVLIKAILFAVTETQTSWSKKRGHLWERRAGSWQSWLSSWWSWCLSFAHPVIL